MAFSIDDLIRFLSGSADGIADAAKNPAAAMPTASPGVLSQPTAGAGRGMVNPPVPADAMRSNSGRPMGVLSPLPVVEIPSRPPIASVMAGDPVGPDTKPDNIDAGGGQNLAMLAPVSDAVASPVTREPSALAKAGTYLNNTFGFTDPDFLSRFGNALAVAGSADPAKALMLLRQTQAEEAKARDAQRARMMPKIVGQAGPNGAIQLVQMPNGEIVPKTLDQVMQMNKDLKAADFESDVRKAILIEKAKDELKVAGEDRKAARESSGDRVQAGLNVQELNSIADALEKTDTASGPVIGFLPKGLRDRIFPEGSSLQDRAERVVQGGLRATLGGQFTQAEGDRFLARAYNPNLDEKQNAANLRTIAREIAAMQLDKDAAQAYFKQNGTLEGFVPKGIGEAPAATAPAAPAAPRGGVARPTDEASYRALPSGTQYVAPDGSIRTKK